MQKSNLWHKKDILRKYAWYKHKCKAVFMQMCHKIYTLGKVPNKALWRKIEPQGLQPNECTQHRIPRWVLPWKLKPKLQVFTEGLCWLSRSLGKKFIWWSKRLPRERNKNQIFSLSDPFLHLNSLKSDPKTGLGGLETMCLGRQEVRCVNGSLLRATGIQSYGNRWVTGSAGALWRIQGKHKFLLLTQSGLKSRGTGLPVILVCSGGFGEWNRRKWTDLEARSCQCVEDWAGLQDSRVLRDMRQGINNILMSIPRLAEMTCKAAPTAGVQWFFLSFSLCWQCVAHLWKSLRRKMLASTWKEYCSVWYLSGLLRYCLKWSVSETNPAMSLQPGEVMGGNASWGGI